jgi:glycosyltransferase involved in cell wall biosynthesis
MNLVAELTKQDSQNEYLFFSSEENPDFKGKTVLVDAPHYSLKEQLWLPFLLCREKLDLMHFPQFNVPVLYFGRYIVTIHDLIKHTSRGAETTTKAPWFYWLKYLGYKIVFWSAVKRAFRILVPSRFVKSELIKKYQLPPEKIVVTFEGATKEISPSHSLVSSQSQILGKYAIKKPYLLYVGSVYPHKNIERLIEAVKILKINLVIVCARNVFWERLKSKVQKMNAEPLVNLVGFIPDSELGFLYREASAYVFPSLSEGFGLPGLEAMAQKVPVLASDIPVFREIYQNAAVYFDPLDTKDIADKIKLVLGDKKLQEELINLGFELSKSYSWTKMAAETLQVYNLSSR